MVGGDVDGEQRGDDGGVGCALLLLRADALHFHDHLFYQYPWV